ncbi:MAG TPA: outer membrane beta-barrel protein [Bacteroidales bacterium]|nr:outer membrane beta-barrel protein [Bacteroidales bacterium]
MKKHLILLVVIGLAISNHCFPQGTDMGLVRRPGAFIGINAGAVRSQIINSGVYENEETGPSSGRSVNGSVDFGYLFSRYLGFKTGIGYSSFSSNISLASYQDFLIQKDSENESYELQVNASNLTESQTITTLNIPMNLAVNIPLGGNVNIFLEPGVNIVIPVGNNFSNSGLFTYKGYYQEYNVVLENLPQYGLPSNMIVITDGSLELKKLWFDAVVYSGIDIAIKPKFHLSGGLYYSRSITDISGYESTEEYHLSSSPDEVISLMGGSDKVTSKSIGFLLTFRYFINR